MNQSKIVEGVIYVFVILDSIDEAPTYYVVPPKVVKDFGDWYNTRALLNAGKLKGGRFEGAWHLIEAELNKDMPVPI